MADFRPLDVEVLRAEVAAFEAKYGVPSDRLFEAFTHSGKLVETDDFLRWVFVAGVLDRFATC